MSCLLSQMYGDDGDGGTLKCRYFFNDIRSRFWLVLLPRQFASWTNEVTTAHDMMSLRMMMTNE